MTQFKILGYVGATAIAIAGLAQITADIVPEYQYLAQARDIMRWSIYLWSYACVIMGLYLKRQTHRLRELLWGLAAAVLCLFPRPNIIAGLIYFYWAFAKLNNLGHGLPY